MVRALIAIGLLAALPAWALDECLGLKFGPTLQEVERDWKAALAGTLKPEKTPVTKNPCFTPAPTVPTHIDVYDCSPDNQVALVGVGNCRTGNYDDSMICGAAIVDLELRKLGGFVGMTAGEAPALRFVGNALVKSGSGGTDLRFGPSYATQKLMPGVRVVSASSDPNLLIVAAVAKGSERLATYRLGAAAPKVIGESVEEVSRIELVPGSPLAIATLRTAEGPGSVIVFDPQSGKTLYAVKGGFRYAVDPSGDRFFTSVEEADAAGQYSLVHQVTTRDGKIERLPSAFGINGQITIAAAMANKRIAVAGPGAVELLTVGPLARTALVRPFGEKSTVLIGLVRWLDARRLLASAGEYAPSTGKTNNQVALIDAVEGKVIKTWSNAVLGGMDRLDTRVQQGTRMFSVGPEGAELPPIAPPPEGGPERTCDPVAMKVVPDLMIQTSVGILMPRPR
jgi:hypothetical protein